MLMCVFSMIDRVVVCLVNACGSISFCGCIWENFFLPCGQLFCFMVYAHHSANQKNIFSFNACDNPFGP